MRNSKTMNSLKMWFRIVQVVLLVLIIMYFNLFMKYQVNSENAPVEQGHSRFDVVYGVSLGVVFAQNSDEIEKAFKLALLHFNTINRTKLEFQLYVDIINTADAFKLSRLICNQFGRSVAGMLGAVAPDSFDTLHSYTNTFQVPFVTPWFPEKVPIPTSKSPDYAVSMRPDYHRAVIDTIAYYGWKHVIFIYDSHDGLLRLQRLYQSLQPSNKAFRITHVKRVSNATDVVNFLGAIERLDRWSSKYVVLDSQTRLAKDALILHVRDVLLGRRNYHYLLSGLVLDEHWDKNVAEYGAVNVTGFRILDFSKKMVKDFMHIWQKDSISAKAALMYDGVHVLLDGMVRLAKKKPEFLRTTKRNANHSRPIECDPKGTEVVTYYFGEKLSKALKRVSIEGLTGPISFTDSGKRRNFTLQVMEMAVTGELVKIGTWYDNKGMIPIIKKRSGSTIVGQYDRNKTYIVSTLEEPPYVIRSSEDSEPNSKYKGLCVDLSRKILDKLEINYEIVIAKDRKHGGENPKVVGGWDGLVGELVRKEVDLVIAPLTVSLEREAVIDFSKPFLSFDVKSERTAKIDIATMFSFLEPLSKELWMCLLGSVFGVSICLYVVSRFSPCEWRVVSFTDTKTTENNEVATTKTTVINEISFMNSMWFSLGSITQQGSDITPRSVSGRIIGIVWWFFALIVIATYTANMTSHLTITRIAEPIQTYTRITTCPEDQVFQSEIDKNTDDSGWFSFLTDQSATKDKKPKKYCEMLVSVTKPGVKDFAVAFPKGSKLRDGVNMALQALKNEGELQQLLRKWFIDNECTAKHAVVPKELSLHQVSGLFYTLLGGLGLALAVSLVEFLKHGRAEATRANVSLREALRAKTSLDIQERKTLPERQEQQEEEQMEWNGGAYSGYYTSDNQDVQEVTESQGSFTQV